MDELQSIVDMIKPSIEEKINSPTVFNLWFGGFTLKSFDGEEAVFTTPTELRKTILSTKYRELIHNSLTAALGFEVKIKIELAGEVFKEEEPEEIVISEAQRKENEIREKKIKEILKMKPGEDDSKVLDRYTFDNFIEGSSNKFARHACLAVAENPSSDYNPLFIWGNSGLGKTHLLCAVINHIKKNNPELKIVYKKSEEFINELIAAISTYTTQDFKEKYREADVLLIDDIQFIAGKVSTQEEFFHTFSHLYESGKQIILTSDRPPHEIKPLEDRLRTRFEGGLIADIQPPSYELRTAIIKKKSKDMQLIISNEMVDYMADRLHDNIRQIEGVITKLHAMYSMTGVSVSKESIDRVISVIDHGNMPTEMVIDRILNEVSKLYAISVSDMKSGKRTETVANARHVAMYVIRKMTDKSYKEIGDIFGRDHSTVMTACDKVSINIKTKKNTDSEIKKIMREVKKI